MCETEHIIAILIVRTIEEHGPAPPDSLVPQNRLAVSPDLLGDSDGVFVFRGQPAFGQFHFEFNIRLARCQTTQLRQAAPFCDGALKPATGMSNIAQKSKGIQEVRLARSIRTDDDDTIPE